mmetsp:Transcript_659/g.2018  ORF Transcript_659/g.2018 Transcript_659/m.2018 type:complete len:371 (-) Transcript_659:10-1122(-)
MSAHIFAARGGHEPSSASSYRSSLLAQHVNALRRVLSVATSPEGYSVSGDDLGYLFIRQSLAPSSPCYSFPAVRGAINDILFASMTTLIVCGPCGVQCFAWSSILARMRARDWQEESSSPYRALALPLSLSNTVDPFRTPSVEFLSLAFFPSTMTLFASSDEQLIYEWSLASEKLTAVYRGHTNAVNTMVASEKHHRLISGGEDGSVRLWDSRTHKCTQVLDALYGSTMLPEDEGKSELHSRPCWVSSVAQSKDENWLLFTGGMRFSCLWYLPAATLIATLPMRAAGRAACFHGLNQPVTAGEDGHVYFWQSDHAISSRMATTSRVIYSLDSHSPRDSTQLTAAGDRGQLSVFRESDSMPISIPLRRTAM